MSKKAVQEGLRPKRYDRRTVIPILREAYDGLNLTRGHMRESVDQIKQLLEQTDLPVTLPPKSDIVLIGGGSGTPVAGRSLYVAGLPNFTMLASSGEMGRDLETGQLVGGGMIYDEIPAAVDCMDTVKQSVFATPQDLRTEVHTLFNARRDKMSLGYLIFEALREMTDNPQQAIDSMNAWMENPYRVVPSTTDRTELSFVMDGQPISSLNYMTREAQATFADEMVITPPASISPEAKKTIETAKTIIVGPGDAYFSVLPHWSVQGIREALAANQDAKIIFIVNLTWRPMDTYGFRLSNFLDLYNQFLPEGKTVTAIFNNGPMPQSYQVEDDIEGDTYGRFNIVRADIASFEFNRNNQLVHDDKKLGETLRECMDRPPSRRG